MIKYVISKEFVEMSQFYITFYIIIILYNIKLFTGIVKNNMFFYILQHYFEITLYYIYKEIKNNKIFYRYFYQNIKNCKYKISYDIKFIINLVIIHCYIVFNNNYKKRMK